MKNKFRRLISISVLGITLVTAIFGISESYGVYSVWAETNTEGDAAALAAADTNAEETFLESEMISSEEVPVEIPEEPATAPEENVAPAPEESVTPVPEESVTPAPEESVAPAPEESVTPAPEESVTPVPEESVTPAPEESVTPVPEESVTPVPEVSVTPTPSITPTPTPLVHVDPSKYPPANVTENTRLIYKILREKFSMNHAAASGVLANIQCESDFSPLVVGDSGTSYGLCQWHLERYTGLVNFCNSRGLDFNTVEGQMEYLLYELQNGYRAVYNYLLNVSDTAQGAYDAAYYWCMHFERPADTQNRSRQRGNMAMNEFFGRDFGWMDPKVEAELKTETLAAAQAEMEAAAKVEAEQKAAKKAEQAELDAKIKAERNAKIEKILAQRRIRTTKELSVQEAIEQAVKEAVDNVLQDLQTKQ